MPIKSVKMYISLNPKIRFLGQTVWPVARPQTDRQTDTRTHRVTTEGTLSGFQDFFLQPIIKDRPNINKHVNVYNSFVVIVSNYRTHELSYPLTSLWAVMDRSRYTRYEYLGLLNGDQGSKYDIIVSFQWWITCLTIRSWHCHCLM